MGTANKAIPLTDDEIAALGVEKREVVVGYEGGSSVKIIDGPLAGFIGLVDEISDDLKTVKVTASLFGRETKVELNSNQVAALED